MFQCFIFFFASLLLLCCFHPSFFHGFFLAPVAVVKVIFLVAMGKLNCGEKWLFFFLSCRLSVLSDKNNPCFIMSHYIENGTIGQAGAWAEWGVRDSKEAQRHFCSISKRPRGGRRLVTWQLWASVVLTGAIGVSSTFPPQAHRHTLFLHRNVRTSNAVLHLIHP